MDAGHKAQPPATRRIIPSYPGLLVGLVVSVLSAFVAYDLFPSWGINSPVLQTIVSSGGVGLGCWVALWSGKRATTA
jgi:hypothetical protein